MRGFQFDDSGYKQISLSGEPRHFADELLWSILGPFYLFNLVSSRLVVIDKMRSHCSIASLGTLAHRDSSATLGLSVETKGVATVTGASHR